MRAVLIDLARARAIVDRALAHARSNDFPPMTVAVFDTAARLVAFAGEDGSSLLRERIARGKAHGALNMGVGSRALAARAASDPDFVNALVALAEGNLVPVPGGVLIRDENGDLIGAVGVSGHLPDDDEACAIHAITGCGLRADPGT
ncbi:heme-binding protein [Nocardia jiangxiensis]|uniref:Heme-binding protein n=1 Tax=Nocardia jiangxiensis TaxID=282685 RepID=A0ABW6SEX8_9NOCA